MDPQQRAAFATGLWGLGHLLQEACLALRANPNTEGLLEPGGELRGVELARIFVEHAIATLSQSQPPPQPQPEVVAAASAFVGWLYDSVQHRLNSADPRGLVFAIAPDVPIHVGQIFARLANDRGGSARVWHAIAAACGEIVPESAEAASGLIRRLAPQQQQQPQPRAAAEGTEQAIGQMAEVIIAPSSDPDEQNRRSLSTVTSLMGSVDAGTCDLIKVLEFGRSFTAPVLETARTEEERAAIEANSRAIVSDFMEVVRPAAAQARKQVEEGTGLPGEGPRQAAFRMAQQSGAAQQFMARITQAMQDGSADIGFILQLIIDANKGSGRAAGLG